MLAKPSRSANAATSIALSAVDRGSTCSHRSPISSDEFGP